MYYQEVSTDNTLLRIQRCDYDKYHNHHHRVQLSLFASTYLLPGSRSSLAYLLLSVNTIQCHHPVSDLPAGLSRAKQAEIITYFNGQRSPRKK